MYNVTMVEQGQANQDIYIHSEIRIITSEMQQSYVCVWVCIHSAIKYIYLSKYVMLSPQIVKSCKILTLCENKIKTDQNLTQETLQKKVCYINKRKVKEPKAYKN